MIRIRDICSMTDFSRHRSEHLVQLVKSGRPIVLTVNGRPVLVVQSAEAYEALLDSAENASSKKAATTASDRRNAKPRTRRAKRWEQSKDP
jgi:prevent-host-death family protein